MLRFIFAYIFIYFLWIIRKFLSVDSRSYVLLFAPQLQGFLVWIAKLRFYAVFYKAQKHCPAYKDFLDSENYEYSGDWSVSKVPMMTKENYVKKYSIEERCYDGKIPTPGTVIDESSGSSGLPNNWVRSSEEREDVKRILQLNYDIVINDSNCILLNCFALGPWATGMNVSMSLADVGILKSIGPDAQKLENTLKLFGSNYRYLIFGYPPFLKSWLDNTTLDLSNFKIDAVVGGEGMSENLRDHLLKSFTTVFSAYGASDLEINIGVETDLTIALRKLCVENKDISNRLFGRETPPMIFQYNAADYLIETTEENELLYTILRLPGASPKIRYNLRDLGGTYTYKSLETTLKDLDINITDLEKRQSAFPILYVHGRGDLSVPFYGAKVFPTDIEQIINTHSDIIGKINSFQISTEEDSELKRTLKINVELMKNETEKLPDAEKLHEIFFAELSGVNQDFREVTKMFDKSCVQIIVNEFETGVFSERDIRVKNKYIA